MPHRPMSITDLVDLGGLCTRPDVDAAWFFDSDKASQDKALALCRQCPIKDGCLEAALSLPESHDYGVFGAATERQRKKIRKERKAAAA